MPNVVRRRAQPHGFVPPPRLFASLTHSTGRGSTWLISPSRPPQRLGAYLVESGAVTPEAVAGALEEQRRAGGRLGEILLGHGLVDASSLHVALAEQLGLPSLVPEHEAVAVLDRELAHRLRAAVLAGPSGRLGGTGPALVAITDVAVVPELREALGREIEPRLADERTLDALLAAAYAHEDGRDSLAALRQGRHRRRLRNVVSSLLALVVLAAFAAGAVIAPAAAVATAVGGASLYALALAVAAARRRPAPPRRPDMPAVGVELPVHSLLVPLSDTTPARLNGLSRALTALDYPAYRLDGVALVDQGDRATRQALRAEPLPSWVRVVAVPTAAAQRRDGLLLYGLRRARGELVTVVRPGSRLAADALRRVAADAACVEQRPADRLAARFLREAGRRWPAAVASPVGRSTAHYRAAELHAAFGWRPEAVAP